MSIGKRLKTVRKKRGISQYELAKSIGVSRGVITNIEYDKVQEPQAIIIDAIVNTLNINRQWLVDGIGEIEDTGKHQNNKVLAELYEVAKGLSEDEQLYLLDTVRALKARLGSPRE